MKMISLKLGLAIGLLITIPVQADEVVCPIEFPVAHLCADYEWVVEPKVGEEAIMALRFWDSENSSSGGPYADPDHYPGVELYMDMGGGHGHGSAPTQYTRRNTGIYEFRRIFFVMRGEWQIKFQIKNEEDQITEEVVTTYQVK